MENKVRVILVTDGDRVAQKAVENIASSLGLRCISASGGNPTPISGAQIVNLIKTVPYDPVLVMFDDRGRSDKGRGERALEYVASHPDIEVLGAVAVASNTTGISGIKADACISCDGSLVNTAVDKSGDVDYHKRQTIITGDTVDILNKVDVPIIIGVGDIGKMDNADAVEKGAPITRKAIEEVLKRSGIVYGHQTKNR